LEVVWVQLLRKNYCLIEYATKKGLTVILICASGGALQEGILSLMQMAKISAVTCSSIVQFIIYFSTNITYNRSVYSKFRNVRRSNFAEPKAVIGFAGRRVIEQTLQEQLPDNFQTAEYFCIMV
jgi:acetyl-CoA carboxylase carboxyl transferase subunit beta